MSRTMPRYSIEVSTEPLVEPVTLEELRVDLGMHHTDHDALLSNLIVAARQWCERFTRRAFIYQELALRMDAFPDTIVLPRPPLRSIVSIAYEDGGSPTATVDESTYEQDPYSEPAELRPVEGATWPVPAIQTNAVTVTYWAGYAPDSASPTDYRANVPEAIRQAIRLLARALYDGEPPEKSLTVQVLLAPYAVRDYRLE